MSRAGTSFPTRQGHLGSEACIGMWTWLPYSAAMSFDALSGTLAGKPNQSGISLSK